MGSFYKLMESWGKPRTETKKQAREIMKKCKGVRYE